VTELPYGWALASLASIAEVNPPPPHHLADEDLVSFVPMASVEAESGRMDPTEHKPIAQVRRKSYRSFAEGDVLFAKVTPCMENGKIALASGLANGSRVRFERVSRRAPW
jgi:type I restriction enzyme, S subunit